MEPSSRITQKATTFHINNNHPSKQPLSDLFCEDQQNFPTSSIAVHSPPLMGLPIIALAKLKLFKLTSQSASTASFWLLLPFLLKLGYGVRPIHNLCHEFIYSARLFFFQMGQITFNGEPPGPGESDSRWLRALRLVAERLSRTRHPQFLETDEESLRALAMIAL